jgi:homoserine dehydrogenase
MSKPLTIGLFGYGCVGTGLYQTLNQSKLLNAGIRRICVKNPDKQRDLPADVFTYQKADILNDAAINVVVEMIDDADAAYLIVKEAMQQGKDVVTANKKMVAEHLEELIVLAREQGVSFLYEAAVCGAIPVIRNLEEYYNNDSLSAMSGICNGTTNFILTNLFGSTRSFAEVLKEAQNLGFAESDPTMDIDGYDAKYKLTLLLVHAFGVVVRPEHVFNYGIRNIRLEDVQYAKEKGMRVKLLAYSRKSGDRVLGFVMPHLVPAGHFAYGVNNEFNAVELEALFSDRQLFTGKGAGSYPTGSAVLSDVSALQFDYKYEYRKMGGAKGLAFSNDVELRVYVGTNNQDRLSAFPFVQVEEQYSSKGNQYVVGTARLADVAATDWNKVSDMFMAVVG